MEAMQSKQSHKLSATEREQVISEYLSGSTTYEVADKWGLNSSSVWGLLHRRGLTRSVSQAAREYSCDENAFDVLTESSAYWCGMMITDGCISDTDGTTRIILSLQRRDGAHVQSFQKFLKSNHPIRECPPRGAQRQGQTILAIRSIRLGLALEKFGVIPRKTHVAKVIGLEMDRHFWRGCIDGDGSVFLAPQKKTVSKDQPVISLCSASVDFAEQFKAFALTICPLMKIAIGHHRFLYTVRVSGKHALAIIGLLYSDFQIALPRKAAAAKQIIERAAADPEWMLREHSAETYAKVSASNRRYYSDPKNREAASLRNPNRGISIPWSREAVIKSALTRRKLQGQESPIIQAYANGITSPAAISRKTGAGIYVIQRVLSEAGFPVKHPALYKPDGRVLPELEELKRRAQQNSVVAGLVQPRESV